MPPPPSFFVSLKYPRPLRVKSGPRITGFYYNLSNYNFLILSSHNPVFCTESLCEFVYWNRFLFFLEILNLKVKAVDLCP